ncbi:MAG: hypothetical protein R3D67_00700 [Hyphomicrobiaceae bacterium]
MPLKQPLREMRVSRIKDPEGNDTIDSFYSGFKFGFQTRDMYKVVRQAWAPAFLDWKNKFPESPTPYIADAFLMVTQAWYVRGNGFVNTVWKEDWPIVQKLLIEARANLEQNKEIASRDPYYYKLMGDIGRNLGEDWNAYISRFEEGFAKFPKHTGLRISTSISLLPQWGGSEEAFQNWADISARETAAQSGSAMYAQLFRKFNYPRINQFFADAGHRAKMRKGLEDWLKYYPSTATVLKLRFIACWLRDAELVLKLQALFREFEDGSDPWKGENAAKQCDWADKPKGDPFYKKPPRPGSGDSPRKITSP